MNNSEIDITPDPQILYVLTYTSMEPIHSICELVDNAIDGFRQAPPGTKGLVHVEIPTARDIREGRGKIRVRDNGPGLTLEQVTNALRAGYTSKKRYGNLGLFGVGFNIATGKLGRTTRFITARESEETAIEVVLDLEKLRRQGAFKLQAQIIPKPAGLVHGTVVEVDQPWGEGNQNYGFMRKLADLGRQKILQRLGRIYATILREPDLRIQVGEDTVEPFYHCVWAPHRSVERMKHGKIPAMFEFKNEVINTARICMECYAVMEPGQSKCSTPGCLCESAITVEEKISGWVGIQRYMDPSHYGIDLIRNGRLIRPIEKAAFFEFQDSETGEVIVDYPIDDRQGRIVGEIHLDQVPVDPAKQDFERSSPEWRRIVEFLRGQSSLQPTKPNAENNKSPIYKLYQGYRKLRQPGKSTMYMGKWRTGQAESTLLTAQEIGEFKARFDKREPGYFTDEEWWKLVEAADEKPLPGLKKCPQCGTDCLEDAQECGACGYVFEGKPCINSGCGKIILRTATVCPHCGTEQISQVLLPWSCAVCGAQNNAEATICKACDNPQGTPDPLSYDSLLAGSTKDDSLSVKSFTTRLASGSQSSPVNISSHFTSGPIWSHAPDGSKTRLPSIRIFHDNGLFIFIDKGHALFQSVRLQPHIVVAMEAGAYIFEMNRELLGRFSHSHSLSKLTHDILEKVWKDEIFFTAEQTLDKALDLVTTIKEGLAETLGPDSKIVFDSMEASDKEAVAKALVRNGHDLAKIKTFSEDGSFVMFLPFSSIINIFKSDPELFFDGNVWNVSFTEDMGLELPLLQKLQYEIRQGYLTALETVSLFIERQTTDPIESQMAVASITYLQQKLNK